MKKILTIFAFLLTGAQGWAGSFDCSTIYDEYDSLMAKNFLVSPQNYVSVQRDKISRLDYNGKQKGVFVMKPENTGWGVAVIHTNKNIWGKFLYSWGPPQQKGQPSLIVRNLVLYGRVMDGFQPRSTGLINVPAGYQLDLDTGKITAASANASGADIWYHIVGTDSFLEATNGAELSLPMESLCRK